MQRCGHRALVIILAGAAFSLALIVSPYQARAADNGGLFDQVDIGLLSVGGRATYIDPLDGSSRWFGGAQVRLRPSRYFAIEGSEDYRRNDIGGSRIHSIRSWFRR